MEGRILGRGIKQEAGQEAFRYRLRDATFRMALRSLLSAHGFMHNPASSVFNLWDGLVFKVSTSYQSRHLIEIERNWCSLFQLPTLGGTFVEIFRSIKNHSTHRPQAQSGKPYNDMIRHVTIPRRPKFAYVLTSVSANKTYCTVG